MKCDKCACQPVCSVYRATGGVKSCEHHQEKRPRGHWIKDGDAVVCSNCGEEHEWEDYRASFCEDCGADMRGKAHG